MTSFSRIRPARLAAAALAALLAMPTTGVAVTVQLEYRYDGGFFSGDNVGRRDLMQQAADVFSTRIEDSLLAIVSEGRNVFTGQVTRPDTRNIVDLPRFEVAEDTIHVFVGGSSRVEGLGEGGPAGFTASATSADFFDTIRMRGQQGATQGNNANEVAPWGGAISFNQDVAWFFDDDLSTDDVRLGRNDFFSVALHELGHVFGVGTSESWDAMVDGGVFTGEAATEVFGENVPTTRDGRHWAENTLSVTADGQVQEAAMDPNLTVGQRKLFTELDFAGLLDAGWEVRAVPLPPALYLFGGALAVLALRRRRAR